MAPFFIHDSALKTRTPVMQSTSVTFKSSYGIVTHKRKVIEMPLKIERIYTKPVDMNGYRILVDRVWPRGISKVNAALDDWFKNIAPTKELRQWFNHEPEKYPEFKTRYEAELTANPDLPEFLALIKDKINHGNVIMLFGAKDETHNQAVVLQEFIEKQLQP